MKTILQQAKELKTVNDEQATDAMLLRLSQTPDQSMWIQDQFVGDICIYRDPRYPKYVIECVMGGDESSVTTLFESANIFGVRQNVVDARKELMYAIGAVINSLPSVITIKDVGRNRDVPLREMSTAQLVDLLVDATTGKLGQQ